MEKTKRTPGMNRRQESRIRTRTPARLDRLHSILGPDWPAEIDEASPCGVRVHSGARLRRGEAVVLRVQGEAVPLHARVVWSRLDGSKHPEAARTWVAGCRLDGPSIGKLKVEECLERKPRWRAFGRRALKILAVLGALSLLAYLFVWLATTIAGAVL